MNKKTVIFIAVGAVAAAVLLWYFILRTKIGGTTTPPITCTNTCPPGYAPDPFNNCQCEPIIPSRIQLDNSNIVAQPNFYILLALVYGLFCSSPTGYLSALYSTQPSKDEMLYNALLTYCKNTSNLTVTLPPITVTGTVYSTTGIPIPNAPVTIGDFNYQEWKTGVIYDSQGASNYQFMLKWYVNTTQTTTDMNGKFQFQLIPVLSVVSYDGSVPGNQAGCPIGCEYTVATNTGDFVQISGIPLLTFTVSSYNVEAQGSVYISPTGNIISVGLPPPAQPLISCKTLLCGS